VARLNGRPIGCGALKVKSRKVGEIKRKWVSHETRGLGLARRLLETLGSYARQLGVKLLRLRDQSQSQRSTIPVSKRRLQ